MFSLPEPLAGRRVYLDFDGAMIAAAVTINGHTFEEHRGGYTPFSFDITDHLNETGENVLAVRLDSTERPDIPPFGHVVDYLTFGGIYRDVRLRYVEPCHIGNVFVKPFPTAPSVDVDVYLLNQCTQAAAFELRAELRDGAGEVLSTASREITMESIWEQVESLALDELPAIRRWELDDPALYTVNVTLQREDGTVCDSQTIRFGFREAEFRKDGGFYLNGRRVKLIGLDHHQTYPYIGAAAPERLQRSTPTSSSLNWD